MILKLIHNVNRFQFKKLLENPFSKGFSYINLALHCSENTFKETLSRALKILNYPNLQSICTDSRYSRILNKLFCSKNTFQAK